MTTGMGRVTYVNCHCSDHFCKPKLQIDSTDQWTLKTNKTMGVHIGWDCCVETLALFARPWHYVQRDVNSSLSTLCCAFRKRSNHSVKGLYKLKDFVFAYLSIILGSDMCKAAFNTKATNPIVSCQMLCFGQLFNTKTHLDNIAGTLATFNWAPKISSGHPTKVDANTLALSRNLDGQMLVSFS